MKVSENNESAILQSFFTTFYSFFFVGVNTDKKAN